MSGLENLLAGKSLVGRYRIEEVIGLGGFAAVYRAADERLGRDVAVKVITLAPPDEQSRERLRERFEREARAAASLPHHPNVITVHDFGHDDELGLDFLVMELLRGENLAQLFKREGHLGSDVALQILCEAAEGIAVGHAAGIIHRDVKPGNIFLAEPHDDDPFRVVVLDFGIARIATDDEELTRTIGENPLTAAYAAPEQMRGDAHLTCAADVFSLGVVGYQLLTGEKPFASGEGRRLRGREPVRPIRELAPVSPAVEGVIDRAMAEDPAARYADAGAFRAALSEAMRTDDRTLLAPAAGLGAAAIADDRTILHTAAAPAPSVAPSPAPVAPRPAERAPAASAPARAVAAPRTRSRAPMFLIALLVLGAIAVGLWAMNRGGGREATAAPRDTRTTGEPLPADGSDTDSGTPVTAGPADQGTGNADGSTDANGTDGTSPAPSDNSSPGDDGQPSAAPPPPPAGIEPTPGIAPSSPPSPVFAPPSAPPTTPPSAPAPRPQQPQPRPQQPRPQQPRPQQPQPQPQQPEPQQPEPQPEPAPPTAPTPAPPVIVTPPTVVPVPNPNAPRDTIVIPTSPAEGAATTAP